MKVMQNKLVLLSLGLYSLFATAVYADNMITEATAVADAIMKSAKTATDGQQTKPQTKPQSDKSVSGHTKRQVEQLLARSTKYHANEAGSDKDTKLGKTSSLVKIATAKNLGFGTVAVDPKKIPYGSVVVTPDSKIYIALDTGGDVITRKASTELAEKQNLDPTSAESRAPVLDFYSINQVGANWDRFLIVQYKGPSFKNLTSDEKLRYLKRLSVTLFPQKTETRSS